MTNKVSETKRCINAQKLDGAIFTEEDGTVSFIKAIWNSEVVSEQPRVLPGRMVFDGEARGDGMKYIPYVTTGKPRYTEIYKTPHGVIRTSRQRVSICYSFPKDMSKADIMRYFYKESIDMRKYAKEFGEESWESRK